MKSYLSGNPEIRLALNEDLSIGRGGGSVYGINYIFFLFLFRNVFLYRGAAFKFFIANS